MSVIKETVQSICIVRLSALGDVLMCLPAVRSVQDAFPNARIIWVISKPAYDLVQHIQGIEFIVIKKPASLGDYWRFYRKMRVHRFDVLLAMQASFRANLLYPLIRAKRKIGYDKQRAKDGHLWFVRESIKAGNDHTLEGFLKFASALGADTQTVRWDIPIMHQDSEFAKKRLPSKRPILLVNPAASKPERSWLVERYVKVMQYASQQWGYQLVLIGGPGPYDRQLANQILKQVNAVDLVGKTKPNQLLAIIKEADALLCPDTGPSHMASAVGTPAVAMHAVTSSKVSGSYCFLHLAVDCYEQAVEKVLSKDPGSVRWGTHVHGEQVMDLVAIESVLQKLALALNLNFKH